MIKYDFINSSSDGLKIELAFPDMYLVCHAKV